MAKKMSLTTTDGEFKIDDTNTVMHFTATVDGQPQSFVSTDNLVFQIKQGNTYIQAAQGKPLGERVLLNSKDLRHLGVGTYELELWHTNSNGLIDIFPDDGFLPIRVNQNAIGDIGETVTSVTMEQLQETLQSQVQSLVQQAVDAIPRPTNGVNGADGKAATISVGTVQQTEPGTMPTVTNDGSSSDAIFSFTFPKAQVAVHSVSNNTLKNCTAAGMYVGSGATTDAPSNHRFTLFVISDGEGGSQHYVDLTTGQTWDRVWNAGIWQEWRETTKWN